MKFKINMYTQEWHTIEIEAGSAEEAHDKALEDGLEGKPTHVEVDLLTLEEASDEQDD